MCLEKYAKKKGSERGRTKGRASLMGVESESINNRHVEHGTRERVNGRHIKYALFLLVAIYSAIFPSSSCTTTAVGLFFEEEAN